MPVEVRAGGRQRWLENGRRGEAVERGEAGGGGAAKVEEVASPRHRAPGAGRMTNVAAAVLRRERGRNTRLCDSAAGCTILSPTGPRRSGRTVTSDGTTRSKPAEMQAGGTTAARQRDALKDIKTGTWRSRRGWPRSWGSGATTALSYLSTSATLASMSVMSDAMCAWILSQTRAKSADRMALAHF